MRIRIFHLLGVSWGDTTQWYYVPYRTLKPYRVFGLKLVIQKEQSSTHPELGEVKYPLKAVVSLENNIVTLDSGRIFSFEIRNEILLLAK